MHKITDCIERILLDEKMLAEKIAELGKKISEDYQNKNLLLVSILKGSVLFLSDLLRKITVPCKIDFMATSSFNGEVKSSGIVRLTKDLDTSIENYDVLIIEDILDSGATLSYILEILNAKKPKSIKICALLDKPEARKMNVEADYVGFKIPKVFVIGYGFDYQEEYRNLPFIGIPKPSLYS